MEKLTEDKNSRQYLLSDEALDIPYSVFRSIIGAEILTFQESLDVLSRAVKQLQASFAALGDNGHKTAES